MIIYPCWLKERGVITGILQAFNKVIIYLTIVISGIFFSDVPIQDFPFKTWILADGHIDLVQSFVRAGYRSGHDA